MTMRLTRLDPQGPVIDGNAWMVRRPTASQFGGREAVQTAIWHVETDNNEAIPGEAAIQFGRIWTGREGQLDSIPRRGQSLRYLSENYRWENRSVFALDFIANPIGTREDFSDSWQIQVVFREPVWGNDEVPRTAHLPPTVRATEYRWDYVTTSESTDIGQRLNLTTGKLGPRVLMVNTAGHPYPETQITRRILVVRAMFNTGRQSTSANINSRFERTTNKIGFSLNNRKIKRHHARFLSCEAFEAGYQSGRPYYRNEIRIEISKTPYLITRTSQGPYYKDQAGAIVRRDVDDNGLPIPGPFVLDIDGGLARKTGKPAATTHDLALRETNYAVNLRGF